MNRLFIDASHYFGLLSSDDTWHEHAVAWAAVKGSKLWTTDYVLLELADGLSKPPHRDDVILYMNELRRHDSLTIIEQSRPLFERGWTLYQNRRDKDWSLTDCISFLVMEDHKLTDALTSDRHFEQAGFRALLRHAPPTNGP